MTQHSAHTDSHTHTTHTCPLYATAGGGGVRGHGAPLLCLHHPGGARRRPRGRPPPRDLRRHHGACVRWHSLPCLGAGHTRTLRSSPCPPARRTHRIGAEQSSHPTPSKTQHNQKNTQIRASTPMFLMSRKIKARGVKMVLSGEGADEIFGGYLYFHKAPNAKYVYAFLRVWGGVFAGGGGVGVSVGVRTSVPDRRHWSSVRVSTLTPTHNTHGRQTPPLSLTHTHSPPSPHFPFPPIFQGVPPGDGGQAQGAAPLRLPPRQQGHLRLGRRGTSVPPCLAWLDSVDPTTARLTMSKHTHMYACTYDPHTHIGARAVPGPGLPRRGHDH